MFRHENENVSASFTPPKSYVSKLSVLYSTALHQKWLFWRDSSCFLLWVPATLMPLPPTEMCNPRWEQRAPTCQPSPAFSKTQFRPDQSWNYPRLSVLSTSQLCFNTHNSCLSNQLEGQSLASNTKGNSCLSCCFWKTLFRKNTGAEPGTSEAKARNSTRQVANQYGLSLRPSGRHATYSQMGCTGTSHLPSPQFAPFMKDVRLWSNLKSF